MVPELTVEGRVGTSQMGKRQQAFLAGDRRAHAQAPALHVHTHRTDHTQPRGAQRTGHKLPRV